jgi:hypothetical protein
LPIATDAVVVDVHYDDRTFSLWARLNVLICIEDKRIQPVQGA